MYCLPILLFRVPQALFSHIGKERISCTVFQLFHIMYHKFSFSHIVKERENICTIKHVYTYHRSFRFQWYRINITKQKLWGCIIIIIYFNGYVLTFQVHLMISSPPLTKNPRSSTKKKREKKLWGKKENWKRSMLLILKITWGQTKYKWF